MFISLIKDQVVLHIFAVIFVLSIIFLGLFFLQKEMNDKLQRATGWIEILGFCREDPASVHGVHAP